MKRHVRVLVFGMAWLLAPSLVAAQGGPPPQAGQRQRMELERRLEARFGQTVREQLGLTQEQLQAVQGVMQSFQQERQTLNRAQASLRYRLRDPGLADIGDEAARELLKEMISLQEQELSLYRKEQEQLLGVLTPSQVVRFYRLREDLGRRVQELRMQRGGGGVGGGPGGGPGGGGGGMGVGGHVGGGGGTLFR